ncbi:MAG: translation initiation factor IF-3 [Gammaproteobacteria bacterium 39-13]|nr:translation initiation factor IF-3 [Gammaproteobacteria bacterium]OJV94368.1 MAG: translation initiation factor IF-3 [Gammaproteobacteria bacterium 39-13]
MTINTTKKSRVRVNDAITAQMVRLVDPDGTMEGLGAGAHTGIMSRRDAQRKAELLGLDLVEVSPNADPPVVRVMDFGKFQFDEKKTKKKQKIQKIKEIKLRPVTDEGDYKVKLRNLISFLERGDKVKVTIRFKGREITHKELGSRLLERIKADIEGIGVIDQEPKLEGRQLVMIISPKK